MRDIVSVIKWSLILLQYFIERYHLRGKVDCNFVQVWVVAPLFNWEVISRRTYVLNHIVNCLWSYSCRMWNEMVSLEKYSQLEVVVTICSNSNFNLRRNIERNYVEQWVVAPDLIELYYVSKVFRTNLRLISFI